MLSSLRKISTARADPAGSAGSILSTGPAETTLGLRNPGPFDDEGTS